MNLKYKHGQSVASSLKKANERPKPSNGHSQGKAANHGLKWRPLDQIKIYY